MPVAYVCRLLCRDFSAYIWALAALVCKPETCRCIISLHASGRVLLLSAGFLQLGYGRATCACIFHSCIPPLCGLSVTSWSAASTCCHTIHNNTSAFLHTSRATGWDAMRPSALVRLLWGRRYAAGTALCAPRCVRHVEFCCSDMVLWRSED